MDYHSYHKKYHSNIKEDVLVNMMGELCPTKKVTFGHHCVLREIGSLSSIHCYLGLDSNLYVIMVVIVLLPYKSSCSKKIMGTGSLPK